MLKADQTTTEMNQAETRLPRILIIDDDESIRKVLRFRLKDSYEIVDSGSPEDALALALQERPDAILLDLSMPGYSGFEVCQTLASLSFTHQIPIIIITGESSARYQEFCENIGAKAFFQKPVDIAGLRKTLMNLTARRTNEHRVEPRRVHLRVALTLKGLDSHEKSFEASVTTESLSANDFVAPCSTPLSNGTIVEVFFSQNPQKSIAKARVMRIEWPDTPGQRCDFRFVEPPAEWVLK